MRMVSQFSHDGIILKAFGNLPDLYRESRTPTLTVSKLQNRMLLFVDLNDLGRERRPTWFSGFFSELNSVLMSGQFSCYEVR